MVYHPQGTPPDRRPRRYLDPVGETAIAFDNDQEPALARFHPQRHEPGESDARAQHLPGTEMPVARGNAFEEFSKVCHRSPAACI